MKKLIGALAVTATAVIVSMSAFGSSNNATCPAACCSKAGCACVCGGVKGACTCDAGCACNSCGNGCCGSK
ncbi:MAG: hypothetical protein JST22_13040 [Bacteroidetes bacterium]|nr:hypothetical protein [Bacteroidota bacterium]